MTDLNKSDQVLNMEENYPRPFPYDIPLSEYEILRRLVWEAFGGATKPPSEANLRTSPDSPYDDRDLAATLAKLSREELLARPDMIDDFDVALLTHEAKKYFAPALMLSVRRHQEGSGCGPLYLGLTNRRLDEDLDSQEAVLAMEQSLESYSSLQKIAFGKYVELFARMDEEKSAWQKFWKQRYIDALLENTVMLEELGFDSQELLESGNCA